MSSVTNRLPRVIPVLDVMGGNVVRAVGGRRDAYKPVESVLTRSTCPVEVADAVIRATGAVNLYVADLDAITGRAFDAGWIAELADAFPRTWVWLDQGLRTPADVGRVPVWKRRNWMPIIGWDRRRNLVPVLGTETVVPDVAYRASNEFAPELAVSIDLRDGRLTDRWEAWQKLGIDGPTDVYGMANAALLASGAASLIVLDLTRVGAGTGVGTEKWLRVIRERWPVIDLVAGGGVRGWEDIDRLGEIGVDGVLVASALHDGRLTLPRPAS
jgi:phosphoribosylformimino-5-aminoimidazole carboxamide ribotide isomerase